MFRLSTFEKVEGRSTSTLAGNSIRDPQRDAHLNTFKSTSVSKSTDGSLAVEGDLTIRGVTRNVVFDVEAPSGPQRDPWGNTRIGLSATTQINRKDFGLIWNTVLETGGILVGDDVTITLDVEFVK
jgi:polyisoprenoid-binding protein YceI